MEKKKQVSKTPKKTSKKVTKKVTTKKVEKKITSKKTQKKKKGFTLIELLAVIIILGILMIIAIPSVTSYISNSRKSAYIDTANALVTGARNMVNEGKFEMFDTDTTYYIDVSCIKTEGANKSPYGEFVKAYVVVTYDGKGYEYYWTSVDETGEGIKKITKVDKLSEDSVESDLKVTDINDTVGIDDRSHYVIIDKDCKKGNSEGVSSTISGLTGTNPITYPRNKNKKTVSIGDIIKIGDEEFYIIAKDVNNNRLTLIAHYNLNVGDNQNTDYPTLLQNSTVLGAGGTSNPYGPISYNDAYSYINEYKNYLQGLGAKIYEARLLTLGEAESMEFRIRHVSSYWLEKNNSENYCRAIFSNYGNMLGATIGCEYSGTYGLRPVIVI